jgi:serine/threonine protein kinase
MHKIFISHSTRDKPSAFAICSSLESKRIRCWIAPRDILAGANWPEAITDAIENSAAIVLVLSEAANASPNVRDEIILGRKFNVPVVQVRIAEVVPARHLELLLSSSQWFDAYPPPLDSHFDSLIAQLISLIGEETSSLPTERKRSGFGVSSDRDTAKQSDTKDEPPPKNSPLHSELLFGVVAAQFNFIDHQQFLGVCAEWCATKRGSIGQMLVERHLIEEEDRLAILALQRRQLARYKDDAPEALLASTDATMREAIRLSGSHEISHSLDGLTRKGEVDDCNEGFRLEEIGNVPRYQWNRLHRVGGLAHIWVGEDIALKRNVAMKSLPPDKQTASTQRKLLREARIAGKLEHPNIVPVYDLGRRDSDKSPFYTMRLLHGGTLSDAIRRFHAARIEGSLDPIERRRMLNVLIDVCNAVAYAHSQGILHLDIKPDNVILGMFNEVQLVDWGLAQEIGAPGSKVGDEKTNRPVGTPAYMSPEQAQGDASKFTVRTDVYGLGSILFEILTDRPPHVGSDVDLLIDSIGVKATPSPADFVSRTPETLVAICCRAMAFDPIDRYENALFLCEQIQTFLSDEPIEVYRSAVNRALSLCEQDSHNEAFRDNPCRSLTNLGIVLIGMERFEEAGDVLAKAIEQYRRLKAEHQDNLQYRVNLAAACLQRRTACYSMGRNNEAEQMARDALSEYQEIIRRSSKSDEYQSVMESMILVAGLSCGAIDTETGSVEDDSDPFGDEATDEPPSEVQRTSVGGDTARVSPQGDKVQVSVFDGCKELWKGMSRLPLEIGRQQEGDTDSIGLQDLATSQRLVIAPTSARSIPRQSLRLEWNNGKMKLTNIHPRLSFYVGAQAEPLVPGGEFQAIDEIVVALPGNRTLLVTQAIESRSIRGAPLVSGTIAQSESSQDD